MQKQLIISRGAETQYLPVNKVLYFEADGNYSHAHTLDGQDILLTYQLGAVANMIQEQLGKQGFRLMRVGRSKIVNIEYVSRIDTADNLLVLSNYNGVTVELTVSETALKEFSVLLNNLIKEGII